MGDFTLADVARIALAWRIILFHLTAKDLSALVRAMPGALARCLESLPPRHIRLLRRDPPIDITVAELEYFTKNVSNCVHFSYVRNWASANNVPAILYALRHDLVDESFDVLGWLPGQNDEISAAVIEKFNAPDVNVSDVIRLGDKQLLAYIANTKQIRWFPLECFRCWPSLEFLELYARVACNDGLLYVHAWIESNCVLPLPNYPTTRYLAQLLISLDRFELARPLIEDIAADGWYLHELRDLTLDLRRRHTRNYIRNYTGYYSLKCRTQDMAVAVSGIFKQ